jgi:hypothetical protein
MTVITLLAVILSLGMVGMVLAYLGRVAGPSCSHRARTYATAQKHDEGEKWPKVGKDRAVIALRRVGDLSL